MVAPYSGMVLAGYGYTWNHRNELVGIDFLPDGVNSPYDYSAEDVTYTYDPRGQLTGANYTGTSISDESYQYDENGNRELVVNSAGWNDYSTEPGNRLSSNGNFVYYYDNEGNRVQKLNLSSPSLSVAYEWDHRNRLTKVSTLAAGGNAVIHSVEYVYDAFNQLIQRIVDSDGDTGSAPIEQTVFVHENGQIVLQFDKTGSGSVGPSHVSHRYLWGPGVDQLLADEVVNSLTDAGQNETLFPLTDHLGSVRDIVDEDGIVRKHTAFDSFGRITGETFRDSGGDIVGESHAEAIDQLFGYTGRPLDESTGLQNNLHRWYDASTGRWISEDPISFAGGDANLYRYVGNQTTTRTDPSGLVEVIEVPGGGRIIRFPDGRISTEIDSTTGHTLNPPETAVYNYIQTRDEACLNRPGVDEALGSGFGHKIVAVAANPELGPVISQQMLGNAALFLGGSFFGGPIPAVPTRPGLSVPGEPLPGSGGIGSRPGGGPRTGAPSGTIGSATTLRPGPYARLSIPARGPARNFTLSERQQINAIGRNYGCHTCGSKNAGTPSGDFIPDHQPPNALLLPGQSQRLYPHCQCCSKVQGGQVRRWQQ